jgi:hypothetical protein
VFPAQVGLAPVLPVYPVAHVEVYVQAGQVDPPYDTGEFAFATLLQLLSPKSVQDFVGHSYRQAVLAVAADAGLVEYVPPVGLAPLRVLQFVQLVAVPPAEKVGESHTEHDVPVPPPATTYPAFAFNCVLAVVEPQAVALVAVCFTVPEAQLAGV